MKKTLLLSILALAALAPQVRADFSKFACADGNPGNCTYDSKQAYCQFSGGCYLLSRQYSSSNVCAAGSCIPQQIYDNCESNGSLYTGVSDPANVGDGKTCNGTWEEIGRNPNETPLGCCNWENNGCHRFYTEKDRADCISGGFALYETCPNDEQGTCVGSPISSGSGSSSSTGGGSSSSTGSGSSSSSTGNNDSPSSSSTGGDGTLYCKLPSGYCEPITTATHCRNNLSGIVVDDCSDTPIINISSVTGINGLKVVAHTHSLHISSPKESTVQIYNMRGEHISNWKVPAGQSILNLKNQKKGVYYAIVSSGSHKQTVKVAVM